MRASWIDRRPAPSRAPDRVDRPHIEEATAELGRATSSAPVGWSTVILNELEEVIRGRRGTDPDESYTARLLADSTLNQRKIMEEAFEVCLELQRPETDAALAAEEAADLIYHLMVGLAAVDVPMADVFAVLEGRRK